MRHLILSAMAVAIPATASGGEPGALTVRLACDGVYRTVVTEETTVELSSPHAPGQKVRGETESSHIAHYPARLSIIFEEGAGKLKPPARMLPMFGKRPADGWWPLGAVSITEDQISGQAEIGVLARHRLVIDRRTGDVTFGRFEGVCEKAAEDPAARKF